MSYSAPPLVGRPPTLFLTPASEEFAISRTLAEFTTVVANVFLTSGTWPSANKPVAVEFWIQEAITVYQLGWMNGSGTMTDSVDVGVYDSSYNRKISTGSTARLGVNALQFVDVANTALLPGRYRLVMANNGTTANQQQVWTGPANAVQWGMHGLIDSATNAFALPDPLTNMVTAATFVSCPLMIIAARATI